MEKTVFSPGNTCHFITITAYGLDISVPLKLIISNFLNVIWKVFGWTFFFWKQTELILKAVSSGFAEIYSLIFRFFWAGEEKLPQFFRCSLIRKVDWPVFALFDIKLSLSVWFLEKISLTECLSEVFFIPGHLSDFNNGVLKHCLRFKLLKKLKTT